MRVARTRGRAAPTQLAKNPKLSCSDAEGDAVGQGRRGARALGQGGPGAETRCKGRRRCAGHRATAHAHPQPLRPSSHRRHTSTPDARTLLCLYAMLHITSPVPNFKGGGGGSRSADATTTFTTHGRPFAAFCNKRG